MTDERAMVDTSAWDGNAAMTDCTSAADYEAVCAGRREGDPSQRQTWALPHHAHPGSPPNADGVRNSLSRLPQTQGLINGPEAKAHLERHMAAISPEAASAVPTGSDRARPPRDNLVRGIRPGIEFRAADAAGDGRLGTMVGHFATFNDWTTIDSVFEGRFRERVAPGAFRKTFAENRDQMRVTLNHGKDPQAGDKPLGPIEVLEEDGIGARYEVPLLDTSYNRDILPGLKAGLYGASFRFAVIKEDFDQKPARSTANPDGLPERTIREARVMEFGPVTFPAYSGATAGVRSLTDRYVLDRFTTDPESLARSLDDLATYLLADKAALQSAIGKLGNGEPLNEQEADLLEAAVDHLEPPECCSCCASGCDCCADACDGGACCAQANSTAPEANALPKTGAERAHSDAGSREPTPTPTLPKETRTVEYVSREEKASRVTEIKAELARLAVEYPGVLPADAQTRWDASVSEQDALERDIAAWDARQARIAANAQNPRMVTDIGQPGVSQEAPFNVTKRYSETDIYDPSSWNASTTEQRDQKLRDFAMRSAETSRYPHPDAKPDEIRGDIARLLDYGDSPDKELARRMLLTGSPVYRRYFNKKVIGQPLSPEEQRAAALAVVGTTTTGGDMVPYQFDPTLIHTGAFTSINPFRAACRVEQLVGRNEWLGVSVGAITSAYAAEAAVTTEQGPTFAAPAFTVRRAQTFITVSHETLQDRPDITTELAALISESKDTLEENKFAVGAGNPAPDGMLVDGNFTATTTITATTTAIADLYAIEAALPLRYRANAAWFLGRGAIRTIQGWETVGGQLFNANWPGGYPAVGNPLYNVNGNTGRTLLGYPIWETPSAPVTFTSAGAIVGILVDPSRYIIVDRVGMNVEVIPNLFGAAQGNLPTGQRGIYAMWRNTAGVINADAGRQIKVHA